MEAPEPHDLRLPPAGLAPSPTFAALVCAAVDEPRDGNGAMFTVGRHSFPTEMLMQLLVSCYACGLYDSENITSALAPSSIPEERNACKMPDARTIRRFRRLHHARLEECLAEVLQSAAHADCCKWNQCPERPFGHRVYRHEARQRIEQAIRLDMVENDV